MKTALYVACVARTYRKAIDDYFENPQKYYDNMDYYKEEIAKCTYRQFTTGFFFGKPNEEAQIYDSNTYVKEYTYLGIVEDVTEDGFVMLTQRNKFSVGEQAEVMYEDGSNGELTVLEMKDEEGNSIESCPHPQQKIFVRFDKKLSVLDLIRRKE